MAGVIVEEGKTVPEQEPVRVLIVDDDPRVRTGLRDALGGAPELTVIGEAGDGPAALAAVRAHAPQVVLLDLAVPPFDGLTATERLRAASGAPEVIVLTTFGADEQVLSALRAGAAGFLLKDTAEERVVAAVRRVAGGDPMLPAGVTRRLIDYAAPRGRPERRAKARQALAALTPREREVANAVADARRTSEIASQLQLTPAGVATHLDRVLAKLDLNNRVQLALLVHDAED
jgi:DNA-binding NarL/FixJ family response regulator